MDSGLMRSRVDAGRIGRRPGPWSSKPTADEDGGDGEKGHSTLCSTQLHGCWLGAHLAPPLPGPGPNPRGWLSTPPPSRGQEEVPRPLGLRAFWFLSGPCFPLPKLFSLAPKEVFFSSEWL